MPSSFSTCTIRSEPGRTAARGGTAGGRTAPASRSTCRAVGGRARLRLRADDGERCRAGGGAHQESAAIETAGRVESVVGVAPTRAACEVVLVHSILPVPPARAGRRFTAVLSVAPGGRG